MGRVWIGIESRAEHLRRMAVVFAVPTRLRIVVELYQREMSPKQFCEEFGGGSVSHIAKHFKRLWKTGWLRPVRTEGPGGARRGGTETIYRSTDLPLWDQEMWGALPYSIRVAFSWNAFKEIAERMRDAMEARTFQARPDRQLSGTRLLLDAVGCDRVLEAANQEFAAQWEEQEDARRRAAHAGEDLCRIGSLLMAFELPMQDGPRHRPFLIADRQPLVPFPIRVSKVFEDEVCMQIIEDANRTEISVPLFHARYGEGFGLTEKAIRARFVKLVNIGWLKQVGQKAGGRRRGGVEKFYSATGPSLYDEAENGPWAEVPNSLRKTDDWQSFVELSDWVKGAIAAGTFNSRDDMCLAWSILSLDQKGWENLVASLDTLLTFILAEQERSKVRLKESGETPVPLVVALGAFETPAPIKEP